MKNIMFGNSLMLLAIFLFVYFGFLQAPFAFYWAALVLIIIGFVLAVIGFTNKDEK